MEELRNVKINISFGTIAKVALVVGVIMALYFLRDIVLLLLTAVVMASAIDPAASWFVKRGVPRALGVLAIYLITLGIIFGTLFFFVPPLFKDFSNIAFKIPAQLSSFVESNQSWRAVMDLAGNFSTKVTVQEVINKGVMESPVPLNMFDLTKLLFSSLVDLGLLIVVSFYLAVQKNGVENFLRIIIPAKHEEYIINLWQRTEIKIGRWMQGQVLLAVIIGPLVYLGLSLFQVEYALTLAIIAAVFELIPIFGPILAAVPAVVLAFGNSALLGIIIIAFYTIVQQFENHLLYPLVVKKIVGINPLVVIISLLVGYQLAGFWGIVLAIPLATLLMEFVNDLEKDKRRHA